MIADQSEMDDDLDEITRKLQNIKGMAKDAGNQLDRHHEKIDIITSDVDKNSAKVAKVNHRLNKKFM